MIWHFRGTEVVKGKCRAEDMKNLGRVEHHGDFVSIQWIENRFVIRRSNFHPLGFLEFKKRDLRSAREIAVAVADDCKGLAL